MSDLPGGNIVAVLDKDETPDGETTKKRTTSRVGNKRFQSTLPGVARTPAFAEAEEARRSLVPGDDEAPLSGPAPWSEPPPTDPDPEFDDDAPSTYPDRFTPIPAEVMAAGLTEGDRTSGEYRIAKLDGDVLRQHAARYLRRGRRAMANGDRQAAIKHFERAIEKDPTYLEAKAALEGARRGV